MTFRLTERGVDAALNLIKGERVNLRKFASQSVNDTARSARTLAARRILGQVALPASYLAPSGGRLVVSKFATPASLEARITARSRPTSLARFARSPRVRSNTVTVQVRRGRASLLRRAFLIRLRRGSGLTDTQHNLGLAIRLRPGERLVNKRIQIASLGRGLYLLYGPSVQQIFLDNQDEGVAVDITPQVLRSLEANYLVRTGA